MNSKRIGNKLRKLRGKRTLAEVSRDLGISDAALCAYELGQRVPRDDKKMRIAKYFGKSVSELFFENLEFALDGKALDYVVVNHMEPDHCATLGEVILRYPQVKIVCNAKTLTMIKQFFTFDADERCQIVKEGESLTLGKHTLQFYMAPMVHWPEVMVTYDTADKVLFSADAFGTFGALGGAIFADECGYPQKGFDEARRYYSNIVGKYGMQTLSLLKKASGLDIAYVCPLHGPIWRKDIGAFVEKYQLWGAYEPEEKGVLIAYASVYGGTQNAAEILASKLADAGVTNLAMYDVSVTDPSYIVSEAFRFSHIVFASTTYNNGIFCNMETLLHDLAAHALKNRTVGIIQNGSWAPQSGKLMREIIGSMQNMQILDACVNLRSTVKPENLTEIDALCEAIAADF